MAPKLLKSDIETWLGDLNAWTLYASYTYKKFFISRDTSQYRVEVLNKITVTDNLSIAVNAYNEF